MNWQALHGELEKIKAEIRDLKAEGAIAYPADFVIDSNVAKGKSYYRKRQRGADGKPGAAKQISADEYAELKRQLENGRKIHRLEQQLARVLAKLDAIAAKAQTMGLSLP